MSSFTFQLSSIFVSISKMPETLALAEYLFKRLRQLGVDSIHGVPGDFNLDLLDYVEPAGLTWVGNVNELNAGYATDGYARIKGLGAIITTFGVGELSAINAIAGAYAERAPVVHIVGSPRRATQDGRLLVHHTFNDGNYRRFGEMHSHVTVAQASLRDPRTSPEQIDNVLKQCLLHSRPVYIEVPVDLVAAPVSAASLESDIRVPDAVPGSALDEALAKVLDRIYAAKQPVILVDGECRALGIVDDVQALIKTTNWPTWTTAYGKGLWDESLPNFYGIYKGRYDEKPVQDFFDQSDLVLCFGPHWSSTNTNGYSSIPDASVSISFTDTEIKTKGRTFRDIPARQAASQLLHRLDLSRTRQYDANHSDDALSALRRRDLLTFSDISEHRDQPLTHDKLWRIFAGAGFLRPRDILLGETGTAGHGVREIDPLPRGCRFFAPATWLSIGYMLPAAQGAALAQRELASSDQQQGSGGGRTILFIGDGSLQMTVQELSTIIRHDLDVIVFVLNNDGYTIERCIHGLHERYNDVGRWRYLRAPGFFGAGTGADGDGNSAVFTASVRTWGELEEVMADERLTNGRGLRMVELVLDREDAPEGPLRELMEKERARVAGTKHAVRS